MSTLLMHTERIASAGCSRAIASAPGVDAIAEHAGTAGFAADATFRGWSANPAPVMSQMVKTTKRTLTPPPRPEDGSP